MSFRSRPVLDRKHRPRWQDELRTQQLTIVGFAVAIGVAVGIFGAAAWYGYWDTHLRPIASVDGTTFLRSDLTTREQILAAEGIAASVELQAQLAGSARDQFIQQQAQAINEQLDNLTANAVSSLVDGAVLASRTEDLGVTVTEADVDEAEASRKALPERLWINLILIDPLPEDADPEDEPTEEQIAAATEEAEAALERVEGGEDFGAVALDVSDDPSAEYAGTIGWIAADDPTYAEYYELLDDAEPGDIIGPVEVEGGVAVLHLAQRRDAQDDALSELLHSQGVSDEEYRAYAREFAVAEAYQEMFDTEVLVSPTEQRRVAQIVVAPVSGTPVPQERARHVLVQPDPELEDQAEATEEQWAAALAEAEEVAELVADPDADWTDIAEEHSDDTGSATRGGDLGWYDPEASPFVEPFAVALAGLEVGDISEPARTDFGYHVIQKTAERESPEAQIEAILERLEADPDSFAEIAELESDDRSTAVDGGELGWVAHWQLSRALEEAVFAIEAVGDISEPVDEGTSGTTIYQLLEESESREIEEERLTEIQGTGFQRWLTEVVRDPVDTWIDPQFAPSATDV
jgi:parvulin-like peptidyl-prolyl isomerase